MGVILIAFYVVGGDGACVGIRLGEEMQERIDKRSEIRDKL